MNDNERHDRSDQPSGNLPDDYDRILGALDGVQQVIKTKPSIFTVMPLFGVGGSTLYTVTTARQWHTTLDKKGKERTISRDVIFLQVVRSGVPPIRVALPAEVADAFARQRDAVTTMQRRNNGRRIAAERKARKK
jgi:hypothetical protein